MELMQLLTRLHKSTTAASLKGKTKAAGQYRSTGLYAQITSSKSWKDGTATLRTVLSPPTTAFLLTMVLRRISTNDTQHGRIDESPRSETCWILGCTGKRPKWLLWRDTQHCKESSAENWRYRARRRRISVLHEMRQQTPRWSSRWQHNESFLRL